MKSWLAVLIIIALATGVYFLCQGILSLIKKSWLHPYLSRHHLGRKALLLIPGIFIYFALFYVFDRGSRTLILFHKLDLIYLIAVIIIIANAILMTFLDLYSQSDKNKSHPLKGLVQGMQVVLYFVGGIMIIAILIDKSPGVLLTSLGASAAVLMLVFKDSILGFVAGVQLSQNNMIRIGDWIQLPDGSANGVVEEITLNTVKVRNWDNTITTIPPYTLVSNPFKNWRGMQESGGRRVDKRIFLDMDSVEFCSEDMVSDILKSVPLMREWKGAAGSRTGAPSVGLKRVSGGNMDVRTTEGTEGLKDAGTAVGVGTAEGAGPVEGTATISAKGTGKYTGTAEGSGAAETPTNSQLYRIYIGLYLSRHPMVAKNLDLIIAQREPCEFGLPIEVYFFLTDKVWNEFETIQSDIFDHLLAIAPEFGLRLYQLSTRPS